MTGLASGPGDGGPGDGGPGDGGRRDGGRGQGRGQGRRRGRSPGQGVVEYGLILFLIVITCVVSLLFFGDQLSSLLSLIATQV
jgi:hypothetical protein